MAFIANTNQFVTGVTPTMYGLGSGSDLIRDLDSDIITFNANNAGEGFGDTLIPAGDPIWSTSGFGTSYSNVQIATDHNGWIAIVTENVNNANTANLHVIDTNGDVRTNTALPGLLTSNWGRQGTLDMAHGRIVVGDPFGNGQIGRILIYDYDGNLLTTKTASSISGSGYYSAQQFGATVAIGNGRIIVGSPEYFNNSSYARGAWHVLDYDGNAIKSVITPNLSPGTNYQQSTLTRYGQKEQAFAIGNGKFLFSHGIAESSSLSKGRFVSFMDLEGHPTTFQQYTSHRELLNSLGLYREFFDVSTDSSSQGVRYGSIGSGVAALSDSLGQIYVIDLKSGTSIGVIQNLAYSSAISSEMPVSVRYGRIAVGSPYESLYTNLEGVTTTSYNNAGAAYVHDLTSDGAQWEVRFDDPNGPQRRGARPLYKFVHPDLETASQTNKYFGRSVKMGNGYVVISAGVNTMEVYCEAISTAMTPYDLIDQQSYGY